MGFVVIISVIYFALFFALAAILTDIAERKYDKKNTPKVTVVEKTPKQLCSKCIGCPDYVTCGKTIDEVIECVPR